MHAPGVELTSQSEPFASLQQVLAQLLGEQPEQSSLQQAGQDAVQDEAYHALGHGNRVALHAALEGVDLKSRLAGGLPALHTAGVQTWHQTKVECEVFNTGDALRLTAQDFIRLQQSR